MCMDLIMYTIQNSVKFLVLSYCCNFLELLGILILPILMSSPSFCDGDIQDMYPKH